MSKLGNNSHEMTTIPNFKRRMQDKHCTIQALYEVTGVSTTTIENARKGRQIHSKLASLLVVALETLLFEYKTKSHKGQGMVNLPQKHDAESISVKIGLTRYSEADNPDLVHKLHVGSNSTTMMPIVKTEEEISRMWAYNEMMGRECGI